MPCNIGFAPDDPQSCVCRDHAKKSDGPFRSGTFGVVAISRSRSKLDDKMFAHRYSLWHVAVGPLEPGGKRRVYAVGDTVVWYSTDAGQEVEGSIKVSLPNRSLTCVRCSLRFSNQLRWALACRQLRGQVAYAVRRSAAGTRGGAGKSGRRCTSRRRGGALGPTYYHDNVPNGTLVNTDCRRLAGEASVWVGDFTNSSSTTSARNGLAARASRLFQVRPPRAATGYVATKATSNGFLLFFSDNTHVHVSAGTPTDNASWHRLDGMDASLANENKTETSYSCTWTRMQSRLHRTSRSR